MIAFWLGLPPWVRTAAMWTGAIILAVITGKLIIAKHDERVLKDERARAELRSEKAKAEIIATITENSREYIETSERVRAHDFADQLPDGSVHLGPENYRD